MNHDFVSFLILMGWIIGIVIGVAMLFAIFVLVVVGLRHRRRSKPDEMACPRNLGI